MKTKTLGAQPKLPVTSYQLPVTSYQLPVTSYQLPVTSYQLPVTSYFNSVFKLLNLILLSNISVFGQYTMNIEFEEPDPALEFNLLECYPDNNFSIFTFDADSLYQLLLNSPDSSELAINLDGDSSITLLLDNYSIYINDNGDSTSFSKRGYVIGKANSSVVCHISNNYFWFDILIDSFKINIDPLKTLGYNFSNTENLYLISHEEGEWNIDGFQDEDCSLFKIEVGVFVDPEGIIAFTEEFGDGDLLKTYIEAQILKLEKFYNDEITEFSIELKLLKIEYLQHFQTKDWDYNKISNLNRSVDGEWNYPNCIKPDLYILYTGISQGGGHGTPGICDPEADEDPGLAVVPFRNSFGSSGNETSSVTVFLAHEVCHILGAGEGEYDCGNDCDPNPSCTPANLMCQHQCYASPSVKMNLYQCSITRIQNYLESRCEACFSSFSDSECNFCNYNASIRTSDKLPLVRQCESRDTLTVFFTFYNDCDGKDVEMRAIYFTTVVTRIGSLQGFNSEIIENNNFIGTLYSPVSYLEAGESMTCSATFKLIEDPSGMGYLPDIPFQISIYSEGTQIFTFVPAVHFKYLKPKVLSGSINLSDLVEPNAGYLFDTDNIFDCSVTNPPVRIDGVLNIDQDYCLYKTWIVMGENAKIAIKDGNSLTINTDKLLGCETMWDAIEVEEGASLVITESSVEDAMAAVRLEENTSFTSTETKYYNNLYGIIASLNDPGDIEFNVLAGNSFTADDTLRKEPVSGDRAKAGIWLDNVSEAVIHGEPPHIEPGMNIFGNMKNGIVLNNTDASIQNFNIYDIKDGPPNIKEVDELPDGHGIYVRGSSGHFTTAIGSEDTRDNYIKAQRGIFVKDANADIQYCNILADLSAIVLGYSNNKEISILNNLINAQYQGITIRLPISLEANISGNRITMPTSNGIGIQCLSSWKGVKIADNLIFLNGSRQGISLTDCKSTYVRENRIIFEDIGENQMKGISLEASSGNIIFDNHVIGKNKDHNTVGIYTQDSPANTLLCNEVKMTNVCYQFAGVSSVTNFHTNNHLTSDFGLLLGSDAIGSEAIIGGQSHKQNTWPLNDYGEAGAMTLTEDPKIIARSIFVVDDSQYPYYPPNIMDLIGTNWFEDLAVDDYEFDCHNLPIEFPDVCCNYIVPTNSLVDFDIYPEIKDFRLRKQLYQSLKDGLIDTSETLSLYEFYNISDTTAYGKLIDVRQLFELASISSGGKKASTISDALAKNSQIPDTEDYFFYETEANEILAEYLDEGDLLVLIAAQEDIKEVATLCPYEFGDGVYMNRSWLRAIDLASGFDEIEACGAIEPRSPMKDDVSEHAIIVNQCHIWPNPAHTNELISVQSYQPVSKIMVTDIIGRKILEYQATSKAQLYFHFQIDQTGWYIITVWDEAGKRIAFHQIVVD